MKNECAYSTATSTCSAAKFDDVTSQVADIVTSPAGPVTLSRRIKRGDSSESENNMNE